MPGRAAVLTRGVAALRGLHRERPFDVLHGFWADEPGAVVVLAGRSLGVPALVSLMGGELAALQDIGYGAALGRGGRWTSGIALRGAAVATVGSVSLFRAAAAVAPGVPLRLLPLGVDRGAFSPGAGRLGGRGATGPARLLFAGSLTPVKDPVLLLRAFARLADAGTGDATLDIAGDGPLRRGLERLAAELGVADRVRFLGAVERAAMPAVYRSADLLVITSRHESQSMVAAEAAACGVPVVGTVVGIVPELAAAGGGIATAQATPGALAAAICEALEPAVLGGMRTAAHAAAERRWDLDTAITRWSGLWTELVSRG